MQAMEILRYNRVLIFTKCVISEGMSVTLLLTGNNGEIVKYSNEVKMKKGENMNGWPRIKKGTSTRIAQPGSQRTRCASKQATGG